MPESSSKTKPPQPPRRSVTASILRWMGLVVLVLVMAGGGAQIAGRAAPDGELLTRTGLFILYVAAAIVCGGLFVGLSALLRILRDLHAAITRLEQHRYEQVELPALRQLDGTQIFDRSAIDKQPPESPRDGGAADIPWRDIVTLLEDIRDTSMLTEEQRIEKRTRLTDAEIHIGEARIRELTHAGDFAHAREAAQQLAQRFPNEPRAVALLDFVESSREKREHDDVATCREQVTDLIAISAWGRAREVAQQLHDRHPDSPEARQLLVRIEKEYQQFEGEQRRRMYAEAQRYATRKRWEEALAAAKTFIQRFPNCEESEALRMQLPTLEKNSEISLRLRLESQIMEYARQGRYVEAVNLAEQLMRDFPESPQADVLKEQLPRLRDLAENPEAAPARIQPESN